MDTADLINALLEATLASSVAIALVLGVRRPLRSAFGARVAYAAWILVPVALVAVLLPAPAQPTAITILVPATAAAAPALSELASTATPNLHASLLVGWLLGLALTLTVFVQRQRRFHAGLGRLRTHGDGLQADARDGLPAVMGWWHPEIILPADFDTRYSVDQRALVLAHERTHIARGDLHVNAFAAALRCVFWFNPLLHFAAHRLRHDQELACDASVVARHPGARRAYGEALLQAQFAAQGAPLGCHFGFGHPLKERVSMLAKPVPSVSRWLLGSSVVIVLALGAGMAAWAAQPGNPAPVVAAGAAQLVNLRMRVDLDGKTASTPTVMTRSGDPFSISDGRFQLEMVATVQGNGTIALAGTVYQGERRLDAVKGTQEDAKPATYRFSVPGADGKLVAMALTVDASAAPDRVSLPMRADTTAPDAATNTGARAALIPPAYPVAARKGGISGKVMLLVDIDEHGNFAKAVVEKSTPPGIFDSAALEAAAKWKFEPAVKDGKPVASRIRIPVEFRPSELRNPDTATGL
ncbi:MAG: TonB family protein [Luteimonas sp.]